MTRRDDRALLWGVGLVAASILLVEVLAFRLAAAALGHPVGMLVGLGHPAAVGLGAAWLARHKPTATGPVVLARSAHLATLGGALAVAAGIAITWVSQKYAIDRAESWHFAIALVSLLLPGMFSGAALALALRRGVSFIGRLGFAEAMGGVLACALLPLAMWIGAPRALLASGLVSAAAATCLGWAGRRGEPGWALIVTLPLAVISLVVGDLGDPWMEVRTDQGRRSSVHHWSWTVQGVIASENVERGEARLQIDRHARSIMPRSRIRGQKPRFDPADLAYVIESELEPGPALVIGSGAGREIDVALAHGQSRVDAVELSAESYRVLSEARYAPLTGPILGDERVKLYAGDGRRVLRALPGPYQRIVVLEQARFDQAAPRLLSRHDRLFTREAIAAYLARLREDGTLTVRVQHDQLAPLIASAVAAIGGPHARDHIVGCAGRRRGLMVVMREPFEDDHRRELIQRCRKSRLDMVHPLEEPRRGSDHQEKLAEHTAKVQALESATAAVDDRPFLPDPPEVKGLWPAVATTARALVPKGAQNEVVSDEEPAEEEVLPAGVAAIGALGTVAALVLAAIVPPPRTRNRNGEARAPLSLRASFPFLGAALALCLFALTDRLLRVLGDPAFAWAYLIPIALVGVGSGRLWIDTLHRERARRIAMMALAIALVWLLMLHVVGAQLEGLGGRPDAVRLGLAATLLLISGFLLGFPLAAGLRFVGDWDRAPVSWCWGVHQCGWALGGAAAALLVRYVGVARLWPLGVAVFAFGAVLLTLGARKAPPPRWALRQ